MIAAPIAEATDWIRMSRLLDVGELVGEDAAQLVLGEQFGDPAGDGDRGVLGVAAGGEGVGLVLGDHVEARHRQAGARRQFAHDLVEPRRFGLLDRLGAAHLQRQSCR